MLRTHRLQEISIMPYLLRNTHCDCLGTVRNAIRMVVRFGPVPRICRKPLNSRGLPFELGELRIAGGASRSCHGDAGYSLLQRPSTLATYELVVRGCQRQPIPNLQSLGIQ